MPKPTAKPKITDARWAKKEKAYDSLQKHASRLRSRISQDLRYHFLRVQGDPSVSEADAFTALAIRLMWLTAERVGNEDSAEIGHVGITGLRKQNVTVQDTTITLDYTAKSGVKQHKQFNSTATAQILRGVLKRRKSRLFEMSNGQRISGKMINDYLRAYGITAKDIRGYQANRMMLIQLESQPTPKTKDERKKVFLEALKKTAKKIGHTPRTLRNQYLMPETEQEYINKK
jgi:DNA topoisomerase I